MFFLKRAKNLQGRLDFLQREAKTIHHLAQRAEEGTVIAIEQLSLELALIRGVQTTAKNFLGK